MSRPSGIVLVFLFLAAAATAPLRAPAQQTGSRASQILLIMPFENASNAPGLDWIGEAFPEVLSARLNSGPLYIIGRDDRLSAFDHLGIPASAKPSRATVYQVAQALDADYVLMGDYRYDGVNLVAHARVMDLGRLRLGHELTEAGPLASLINTQTALAWDLLNELQLAGDTAKIRFVAQFPPIHLDALENYIRGVISGNDQEKIKRFKQAVTLDPGNTLAILQLGKSYYNIRDYASAVSWLGKIPGNDPSFNQAQFYLGLAALNGDQLEKAGAAFHALSLRLPLIEVFNNLGVVSARMGKRDALGYFQKTVQSDPNDPDYHFNLAIELCRAGDNQAAARELRAALLLHDDADAKSLLEAINTGAQPPPRLPSPRIKHNYDESGFRQLALEIENAEEARLQKTEPVKHAEFHVQRGEELLNDGVLSEAEKQFREAVILDPTNAGAHAGLARVLEFNQDAAGARNEATASLRLRPLPEAYLVLARLDMASNNLAGAKQNLDHALALDPGNATAAAMKHDLAASKSKQPQE